MHKKRPHYSAQQITKTMQRKCYKESVFTLKKKSVRVCVLYESTLLNISQSSFFFFLINTETNTLLVFWFK